jgi:DNA-binding MarR family transcriptional regulator
MRCSPRFASCSDYSPSIDLSAIVDVVSSSEYQAAAALRAGLRRFLRRSEEIARRHGLTPRQYLLLLMIKAKEDTPEKTTITDLVERLALTQSTITELVQRAEEAGLVARSPSQVDGRVTHLLLTPLGNERLVAAFDELGPERTQLSQLFDGT